MTSDTNPKIIPPYRFPRAIYERAEAEAQRRRRTTGEDVKWTKVVYEILEKHLPRRG